MRPGSSWTVVSRPCLMISSIALLLVEIAQPVAIPGDREDLVINHRMLIRPVIHFRFDEVVLLAPDRREAHTIPRAKERETVVERSETLILVPDRHGRASENLVAAGRAIGVHGRQPTAHADRSFR